MSSRSNAMLRRACEDAVLVKFTNPFDDGLIHGYVLEVGPQFFLLALLGQDMRFDGFQCSRLQDVKHLRPDPYADFAVTALRKRRQQLRKKPNVDISELPALLKSASKAFPLVTIHREGVKPDACWIGRVLDVTEKSVVLHEIGPDAVWEKRPSRFRLSEITRVEFGGGYEEALELVGGPAPGLERRQRSR
jgi:hypothetical protein